MSKRARRSAASILAALALTSMVACGSDSKSSDEKFGNKEDANTNEDNENQDDSNDESESPNDQGFGDYTGKEDFGPKAELTLKIDQDGGDYSDDRTEALEDFIDELSDEDKQQLKDADDIDIDLDIDNLLSDGAVFFELEIDNTDGDEPFILQDQQMLFSVASQDQETVEGSSNYLKALHSSLLDAAGATSDRKLIDLMDELYQDHLSDTIKLMPGQKDSVSVFFDGTIDSVDTVWLNDHEEMTRDSDD